MYNYNEEATPEKVMAFWAFFLLIPYCVALISSSILVYQLISGNVEHAYVYLVLVNYAFFTAASSCVIASSSHANQDLLFFFLMLGVPACVFFVVLWIWALFANEIVENKNSDVCITLVSYSCLISVFYFVYICKWFTLPETVGAAEPRPEQQNANASANASRKPKRKGPAVHPDTSGGDYEVLVV